MPPDTLLQVSVIIPVYNNAQGLARCLRCLERQTVPRETFEILIVDNGSNDDSADVAQKAGARVLVEAKPGSYVARNRGIAESRGRVLAFTDSDCLPRPDWLEKGLQAVDALPEPGYVAGAIAIVFLQADRPTAAELYDSVFYFDQERYLARSHFAATANLLVTKEALYKVGPFDVSLKSGGDLEWGNRARSRGLKAVYCPIATVDHPARATFGSLCDRALRIEGGLRQLRRRGLHTLPAHGDSVGAHRSVLLHKILALHETFGWGKALGVLVTAVAIVGLRAFERLRLAWGSAPRR